jgi:S-adenosylmethionine-diacylgycerolhomoserine-N-methlytransferase
MTVLDHGGLMDRVYRHQRHIYDATRKYYLFGRDPMIAGLKPPPGSSVLEIGCGTGRNLVKAARRYPQVSFFGIDISREMLETAGEAVVRAGLRDRIRLACADAEHFDPQKVFGRSGFDRVFISYAVSMIPSWQAVMAEAFSHLTPGGELHVVDFGDQREMPAWFRSGLRTWLRRYHVTPRPDLHAVAAGIAAAGGGTCASRRLYRDFARQVVVTRGSAEFRRLETL